MAYLVNNILSDKQARLPAFGPANALELSTSRPAAAKTGTTNDNRDAWTVGYTPQLVTRVWVGNNNNSPMTDNITGSTAAAPIWRAIMDYYHARDNLPPAIGSVHPRCRSTDLCGEWPCRDGGVSQS